MTTSATGDEPSTPAGGLGGGRRPTWIVGSGAPQRLTRPLMRGVGGKLVPVSWDVALDHIAARLREVRAEHGASAVAIFDGGHRTLEGDDQMGRLADLLAGRGREQTVRSENLLGRLGTDAAPRALLVHGADPVLGTDDPDMVREQLRELEFLVVADLVASPTSELADVVLPLRAGGQHGGRASEPGRGRRRRSAGSRSEQARSERWILGQLAARLGSTSQWPADSVPASRA